MCCISPHNHKLFFSLGVNIPIIPGIAPIQSYASFQRLKQLCGTRVPEYVEAALDPIKVSIPSPFIPTNTLGSYQILPVAQSDDQKVKDFGVKLAIDICSKLTTEGDIKGVHFCTLNLEKSVRRVLEGLGWSHVAPSSPILNKIIIEDPTDPSSHLPADHLISASDASHLNERPSTPSIMSEKENGLTEPVGAATWDDFHNGRFGDSTSPAYGALDSWAISGLGVNVSYLFPLIVILTYSI